MCINVMYIKRIQKKMCDKTGTKTGIVKTKVCDSEIFIYIYMWCGLILFEGRL